MVFCGLEVGAGTDGRAERMTQLLEQLLPEDMQKEWAEPWSSSRPDCKVAKVLWFSPFLAIKAALNAAFRHDMVADAGLWAAQERHPDDGRHQRVMRKASAWLNGQLGGAITKPYIGGGYMMYGFVRIMKWDRQDKKLEQTPH